MSSEMGFLSLKLSGTIMLRAFGSDMPFMTKNSNTLSKLAESLMSGCIIGEMSCMSPKASEESTASRAFIHERLPRMVFISPLCAKRRKGWASDHVGNVLVEKRLWTKARPLVK